MFGRQFLTAVVACLLVSAGAAAAPLRIGIVTDVHAHDTNSPIEHKVMTNFSPRLAAFVDAMNAWPADAVFELGDLVNGAFVMGEPYGDPARVAVLLDTAVAELARFPGPAHFVLGNHDVYSLSKADFLDAVGAPSTRLSFDLAGYHMVILDAEFTKAGADMACVFWMAQGTIPSAELDWLRQDLAATSLPTVVFIHQPLDVEFELEAGGPSVSNHTEVQAVLAQSGHVIAVFQGHSHENRHTVVYGVHYVTFAAMVDLDVPTPPSWAAVTLDPDARTVRIDGEGLQEDLEFSY
jgi:alkaline phosphatase